MNIKNLIKKNGMTCLQYAVMSISLGFVGHASAIIVTPTNVGETLASSILGSGITVTSPIMYQGSSTSAGLFSDASDIGIESGIILTTGNSTSAVGPNSSDSTTGEFGGAGNPNLDALIPQSTNDATTLGFEFTTDTGDLFFNYIFASEEYNEFVNTQFNDVFAFFVNGVNIALTPDGNPVSINSVNCGNPFSGSGPNCDSYVNNSPNDAGDSPFNLEYDGFTQVFTAAINDLGTGSNYMEFSIADAGDFALDSAVLIAGGTFTSVIEPKVDSPVVPEVPEVPVPEVPEVPEVPTTPPTSNVSEPTTTALFALSLFGAGWLRKKRNA